MSKFDLSEKQMRDMYFASVCRAHPDGEIAAALTGLEDIESPGDNASHRAAALEKLQRGSELLETYRLVRQRDRFLRGLSPTSIPNEAAGWLVVPAGYVGTSEMQALVYAVLREGEGGEK